MATAVPSKPASSKGRPDPAGQARDRLLMAALRLFADQGFTRTSTREIAQAAGANVAAIRYYFGDKAGLYRAAFTEPLDSPADWVALQEGGDRTIEQSLALFMAEFLAPLKNGELASQCMRLHFREMLEPTSLWQEAIRDQMRPAHMALVRVLCRHLGLRREDDDVHRLAFAIVALPMQLFVSRDMVDAVRPRLIAGPRAIATAGDRLAGFALAMVEAEARRRAGKGRGQA
jgi:AcrR family transcriptional regulator